MHFLLALSASLIGSALATPRPQGVTEQISPKSQKPSGCDASYKGSFEITVLSAGGQKQKRSVNLEKRGALTLTLENGILKDGQNRIGYVADNYQFQFDGPPQTGAIYTAGFSACSNGSIALGGSAIWYQCLSGGFYNLYDRWWAAQCAPVYLSIIGAGGNSAQTNDQTPTPSAGVMRVAGTPGAFAPVPVNELADGQAQGLSAIVSPTMAPATVAPYPTAAPAPATSPCSTGSLPTYSSNSTLTMAAPTTYTGAAATQAYQLGAFAAALMGFAALF